MVVRGEEAKVLKLPKLVLPCSELLECFFFMASTPPEACAAESSFAISPTSCRSSNGSSLDWPESGS
jgi:hypothetical protein